MVDITPDVKCSSINSSTLTKLSKFRRRPQSTCWCAFKTLCKAKRTSLVKWQVTNSSAVHFDAKIDAVRGPLFHIVLRSELIVPLRRVTALRRTMLSKTEVQKATLVLFMPTLRRQRYPPLIVNGDGRSSGRNARKRAASIAFRSRSGPPYS